MPILYIHILESHKHFVNKKRLWVLKLETSCSRSAPGHPSLTPVTPIPSMPICPSFSEHIPVSLAPGVTLQVPRVSHGRLIAPENLPHPEGCLGNRPSSSQAGSGLDWSVTQTLPDPGWWSSIPRWDCGEGLPHRVGTLSQL